MGAEEIVKFLIQNLNVIGVNPDTNRNLLLMIVLGVPPIITWWLGCYQLYHDELTFQSFANTVETVIATTHCNVKYFIFIYQYRKIQLLLHKLKNFISVSDNKENIERLCHAEFKKIKILRNAYVSMGVACTIIPSLKLILMDELVFDCHVPDWIPMKYFNIINGLTIISAAILPVTFDLFSFTIISLLKIPIKMINIKIAQLGIGEYDDDAHNALVLQRLKDWIKSHHLFYEYDFSVIVTVYIIYGFSCLDSVNSVVGWGVLMQLLLFIATVCFELFFIARAEHFIDSLQSIIYVVTMMFELLFCYCWPSDSVTEEASNTSFCLYDTKWYNCSSMSIKKILLIVMVRTQKHSVISCRNMIVVNLETFTNAFKASLSYFSTLQAMDQKYSVN